MTQPEKRSSEREITYHVGWKKGKIQVQDNGDHPKKESPAAIPAVQAAPPTGILKVIWREAPYPGERAAVVILTALPIAAFAAILWLCSLLSKG